MSEAAQGKKQASGQMALFSHGPYSNSLPYAGMTVRAVREEIGAAWNIPKDASAMIGKEVMSEDYVIKPGDEVNFFRKLGEKGA